MTRWDADTATRFAAPTKRPGRHRPRGVQVNEERIPTLFLADVTRLMRDGLGIDDAMLLAGIDADDALTAWRAAS